MKTILKIFIALSIQFSSYGQIVYRDVFKMKNGCVFRGYKTFLNVDSIELMTIDSIKYILQDNEILMYHKEIEKLNALNVLLEGGYSFSDGMVFNSNLIISYRPDYIFSIGICSKFKYFENGIGMLNPCLDLKFYILNIENTPYLNLRVGSVIGSRKSYSGLNCDILVGHRARLSKICGINFSTGVEIYFGKDGLVSNNIGLLPVINVGIDFNIPFKINGNKKRI